MSMYSLVEIQVAEALLELQSNARVFIQNVERCRNVEPNRSRTVSSNIQVPAQKSVVNLASVLSTANINKSPVNSSTKTLAKTYNAQQANKRSKIFKRKAIKYSPVVVFSGKSKKETLNTLAKVANVKCVEQVIGMKAKSPNIETLTDDGKIETEIKTRNSQANESTKDKTHKPDADVMSDSDENYELEKTLNISTSKTAVMNKKTKAGPSSASANTSRVLTSRNINTETSYDMVPIGSGKAKVPASIFRFIRWDSYTMATRKLLSAVFTRRVLATHCLTGERSKAFPTKPQKKKLDAALVSDIVDTVVERCRVPANVVRMCITTKCADESKMLRSRQTKEKGKIKQIKENIISDLESD